MKLEIEKLKDDQLNKLINNRWDSSSSVWDTIEKVYKTNTAIYEDKADWQQWIPYKRQKWLVQANRIFVNMEAVINSLIANPPGINFLQTRDTEDAKQMALTLENYFRKKYSDLNIKEVIRMGLRNLYFGRLLVIKAFWNTDINDFDFRSIDPRKLRVAKYARKEQDSEFAIEEIEDNLCSVIEKFPAKKEELMRKKGIASEEDLYVKNPEITYKECWIQDYVIFQHDNIILDKIKNPYWDWDGILITEEEEAQIKQGGKIMKDTLTQAKLEQSQRQPEEQTEGTEGIEQGNYKPYYFNHFDNPRKPYIIATIFNNENTPIGRTDMITLSASLQKGINKRKIDIDENCENANGILKIDSSVMDKSDAQKLRFETKGIIWGKGVNQGVTRETGPALPAMVFDDMIDSRQEIDNIMAATSAFRGEREGQETKAGRLALIQQSYLRLNELVQVVDYVCKEIFDWGYQLAKTRYTEYHYAKFMGKNKAQKVISLIQDDLEDGTEIEIIAGKTLPKDDEFKFEQAQNDVQAGLLSPVDYMEIAQYDNPRELAKNNVLYKQDPATAVGIAPEEMPLPAQPGQLQPDQASAMMSAGVAPSMEPMPLPTPASLKTK